MPAPLTLRTETLMSARFSTSVLGAAVANILLSVAALAAPAHEALVIGNATYASLPALPGCLLSAHAVSAALRGIGFDVVEREDVSSGGTDAAIGDFASKLTAAPGAAAFVYTCGHVTALNDRPFLLPVSANIARPTDALTQGVLAKSLIDVLRRGNASAAVVAIDVFPAPGAPDRLGLDALAQGLPGQVGLIAASSPQTGTTPTALATALVAQLKGQDVQTGPLLAAAGKQTSAATLHLPATSGYLSGSPPAPAPAAATTAAPPPTAASLPADDQMSETDRRLVQTKLAKLGYYDGKVDGIFGPDTRAAIRRYQHELGAEMTGRLTAAQATGLAGGEKH
jgi:hypothetical protein